MKIIAYLDYCVALFTFNRIDTTLAHYNNRPTDRQTPWRKYHHSIYRASI